MRDIKKVLFVPLMLVLSFTATAPAGAEEPEEPPAWPPEETGGRFVPVDPEYYDRTIDIGACGTKVTMTSGDIREVEEKVNVKWDGRTVIRYRGEATVDLFRHANDELGIDEAFIDELDISGPATERWSADQTRLSSSLWGSSIIWPLSAPDAEAIADAGLPEFSYYEEGRLTFELTFSDPNSDDPTASEITRNSTRDVRDVCEMLDEASRDAG